MLPQLFVLSLSLFGLSRACNSVIITDDVDSAFPTNVCIVRDLESLQKSMKMVCDSSGVGKVEVFEDNLDCSGVPTSVEDPCSIGSTSSSCNSTAICDSTPCSYTRVQMYEGVTSCNGDSAVAWANYTDMGMTFGATCVDMNDPDFGPYSYSAACVNGAQEMSMYSGSGCSGTPMMQMPMFETGCDVANATAYVVSCDQTAPGDGTGSPSKSPSESPSKGPTGSPVQSPTVETSDPSKSPSQSPIDSTSNPSEAPTDGSVAPSEAPTNPPTSVAATTDSSHSTEETEGPEPTGKGSGNTFQYLANFITFFVFSIHMIMT